MLQKTKSILAVLLISTVAFFSCSKTDNQIVTPNQSANEQSNDSNETKDFSTQTRASLPNSAYLNYIGYTEGEIGCPTVYFKEGRYTQCHSSASNVGWHPVKPKLIAANISPTGVSEYYKNSSNFLYYFTRRYYRSNASNARYFEYSQSTGITHLSRSRLNSPDSRYNATYAKNVVKNGKVAANEQ